MDFENKDSLLYALLKNDIWTLYIEEKVAAGHINKWEEKEFRTFVESGEYLNAAKRLISNLNVAYPRKVFINKMNSDKKRVVYSFQGSDNYLLKLITWLMQKYDGAFSNNCYAFRKNRSIRNVCSRLCKIPELEEKYALKIDIQNYFNSIPVERLVEKMKKVVCDDLMLQKFLENLLTQNKVYINGTLTEENRGAMAGCPLGGFFANLYLTDLDNYFAAEGIPYFRYSDDIIFFTDSKDEQEKYERILIEKVAEEGLSVNQKKSIKTVPGELWDFLGISYKNGEFDLSPFTVVKIKRKIAKRARGLYVWKSRKNASFEKVAGILIRDFNNLFFGENRSQQSDEDERIFSWERWYFPVITTSKSLEIVDRYLQEYIRYLYSGRHYKGNYKITYENIKALGYKSLVNNYYKKEIFCGSVNYNI